MSFLALSVTDLQDPMYHSELLNLSLNTVRFRLPNNSAWVFSAQCCGYHLHWIMCIKLDFVSLEYDKNTLLAIKGQFLAAGKFSVIDARQRESASPLKSGNY